MCFYSENVVGGYSGQNRLLFARRCGTASHWKAPQPEAGALGIAIVSRSRLLFDTVGALVDSPGGNRQAVEVDEALGGGAVEGVAFTVGGQALVVQAPIALAADDGAVALVELQANGAVHALLRVVQECIERILQGRASPTDVRPSA